AIGGMLAGFATWLYTLFLPSFLDSGTAGVSLLQHGPFGIEALRPQALFGADLPPLLHGVLWSLSLNILTYVVLSLARQPSSIERLQAGLFVPDALAPMTPTFRRWRTTVTVQDIRSTVAQYLGPERASHAFDTFAAGHHTRLDPAAPADFELLQHAEHLIASSIGAASSRLVMSLLLRKRTVSAKAALKLLDDSHAALHFNREILQTALNHVRQGIAVFDADLQLICSNRQFGEIFALTPHLVQIGIPLREILEFMGAIGPSGSDDRDTLIERRLKAYTTEGEPYLERLPDRHMVVEVRSNRMPDGGLVITFTDVTPSFEAAEALERANATLEKRVRDRTEELTRLNSELALAKSTAEDANISKTRFLAAASHDILQPLNAARLYVTSLVERQNGGEDSRLVENIDESLEAIEEILGALLDISRLDAGAMTPAITSFKMADLMRSLEIEFAPSARAKGLELIFVLCSLPVESDRLMLRRLLQNFISNAIKYTPQGRVLVGCRRRGQSLQIGVHDTGVGIPVLKRGEIFK
ncbi:MAG TPA: PAS-domain containing protein, partial [Bradyrhizobium sp.]|nr:PAS-domain containing protein [Bradyrhizobium sp.]